MKTSAPQASTSALCVTLLAVSLAANLTSPVGAASQRSVPDRSGFIAPTAPTGTPRLRLRIAVDQFKWDETRGEYGLPRDLREGLQALLIDRLRASGYFQVMEREATTLRADTVEDRIDEQKRESLPPRAMPPPRARRTPAQFIITPTVTGFQVTGDGNRGISLGPLDLRQKKQTLQLTLNIRISNAQTSAVLESATASGRVVTSGSGININVGPIHTGSDQTRTNPLSDVVDSALNDAVAKIVARLSREPWAALVANQDPSTGRVAINVGSDAGVSVGQEFVVFRTGTPVRDPDTGDVLSFGDETAIGRIRIVRVDRDVAFGDVVQGSGFAPRNLVRPAQ